MLLQIGADAGPVGDNGYAELAQFRLGADAGAQQDRRRVQRASRDNDLAAMQRHRSAVAQDFGAGAARAIHQQAVDLGVGDDGEVRAPPDLGIEIGHRRRDAVLAVIGQRLRKPAISKGSILVGNVLIAHRAQCLDQLDRVVRPFRARNAGDRDRTDVPCIGPAKSRSRSSFMKKGRTPFQSQPLAPRALHSS